MPMLHALFSKHRATRREYRVSVTRVFAEPESRVGIRKHITQAVARCIEFKNILWHSLQCCNLCVPIAGPWFRRS